jgi:hypothetical protein
MDHILARIRGIKMEDVKNMLKGDTSKHARPRVNSKAHMDFNKLPCSL